MRSSPRSLPATLPLFVLVLACGDIQAPEATMDESVSAVRVDGGGNVAGVGHVVCVVVRSCALMTVAVALQIEIFKADHTAYSKKLDRVVMMRDAPDHTKDDFVLLSGTKVREMLGQGIALPPEFSRPEVAKILMDYYQEIDSRE